MNQEKEERDAILAYYGLSNKSVLPRAPRSQGEASDSWRR